MESPEEYASPHVATVTAVAAISPAGPGLHSGAAPPGVAQTTYMLPYRSLGIRCTATAPAARCQFSLNPSQPGGGVSAGRGGQLITGRALLVLLGACLSHVIPGQLDELCVFFIFYFFAPSLKTVREYEYTPVAS